MSDWACVSWESRSVGESGWCWCNLVHILQGCPDVSGRMSVRNRVGRMCEFWVGRNGGAGEILVSRVS